MIKGFVFLDQNGNGERDPGESWVNGAQVDLQDASRQSRATRQTTGFGQIYQSDLAKIGVKMNIKNYDGATWLDQVNGRKFFGIYMASGTYFNLSPSTAFTNGKAFNHHRHCSERRPRKSNRSRTPISNNESRQGYGWHVYWRDFAIHS